MFQTVFVSHTQKACEVKNMFTTSKPHPSRGVDSHSARTVSETDLREGSGTTARIEWLKF